MGRPHGPARAPISAPWVGMSRGWATGRIVGALDGHGVVMSAEDGKAIVRLSDIVQ